ncbi:hypothetical protein PV703_24755 [Streptomyces sp. ME01-24h]|nr:hypothetical protein [Streptomyces sp. ME19-03-3]MDX3356460.1 hypothetical protein [Streptomyces sp. ME01-24h]
MTVFDASGKVVATGALSAPAPNDPDLVVTCSYTVTVPEVPRGERFYGVEVSHRGKISISAADAGAGGFMASPGNWSTLGARRSLKADPVTGGQSRRSPAVRVPP